jgi:hypothetical protein
MLKKDWNDLEQVIEFLRYFKQATVFFSATRYPTIVLVLPVFHRILAKCSAFKSEHKSKKNQRLVKAVDACLEKLNKYLDTCSDVHFIAVILDQRLKLTHFEKYYSKEQILKIKTR